MSYITVYPESSVAYRNTVASPGFVARWGKAGNYVMGHLGTADFRAGCSS